MTFKVEFTPEAPADLDHLFDFMLDRAETVEDAIRACEAVEALSTVANSHLSTTPYSCRWAEPTLLPSGLHSGDSAPSRSCP